MDRAVRALFPRLDARTVSRGIILARDNAFSVCSAAGSDGGSGVQCVATIPGQRVYSVTVVAAMGGVGDAEQSPVERAQTMQVRKFSCTCPVATADSARPCKHVVAAAVHLLRHGAAGSSVATPSASEGGAAPRLLARLTIRSDGAHPSAVEAADFAVLATTSLGMESLLAEELLGRLRSSLPGRALSIADAMFEPGAVAAALALRKLFTAERTVIVLARGEVGLSATESRRAEDGDAAPPPSATWLSGAGADELLRVVSSVLNAVSIDAWERAARTAAAHAGAEPRRFIVRARCSRQLPLATKPLAEQAAMCIHRAMGWIPDLSNPEVTVDLRVVAADVRLPRPRDWPADAAHMATITCGVALSEGTQAFSNVLPLAPGAAESRRGSGRAAGGAAAAGRLLHRTALRPTVAYALQRHTGLSGGDLLIDAMTGAGTAAEVASVSLDGRLFVIAGDVDAAAVRMAAHNAALAAQAGLTHDRIDIVRWSATRLPLRSGCADRVLADLPFGRRVGNRADNEALYSAALAEFARIATVGRTPPPGSGTVEAVDDREGDGAETVRCAVLTTHISALHRSLAALRGRWAVARSVKVRLGSIEPTITALRHVRDGEQPHREAAPSVAQGEESLDGGARTSMAC